MASGQLVSAMLYLVLFSVGVMLSMLVFGLGLANVQQWLIQRYQRIFHISRYSLALSSIGLGSYWLVQAV